MAMADTLYKVSGETADDVVCLPDIKEQSKHYEYICHRKYGDFEFI